MTFKARDMKKLSGYLSNFKKQTISNLEKTESGILGAGLDKVTPEDTGALVNSKSFSIYDENSTISLTVGYSVDYAPYVHAFTPTINWTKMSSDYQFLQNYIYANTNDIFKSL